ncbi:MAG TPA: hypothetical protein VKG84_01830 [Candidatus Acidoferrales bacterium]|nr:hypothetical protein [Candidatus Acidoferrales bacterium]
MKRIAKACCIAAAVSFFAVPAFAQHGHHHHDNAAQQKDVKMTVHQVASDALEIRLGPYDLPAHTGHDEMPQAPEFFWDVPFDGWLVSYAPSLIDGDGNDIPPKLLHHVAFYNTGRSDFLCPNKEEHVFGSGGELNRWPPLPGFGYPVHRGDRIRISTMFHNPTGTSYHAFLSVQVNYVSSELVQSGIPQLRSVYPAWFDVMQCGESGYDLKSGESVKSGQFQMQQAGLLLGLGGHLHDYGHSLTVLDTTHKQQIAKLNADLDEKGSVQSIPIVTFLSMGGYHLAIGDKIQVSAEYMNMTGQTVPDGAMGIAVGYFLPDDPAAMNPFARAPKEKKSGEK